MTKLCKSMTKLCHAGELSCRHTSPVVGSNPFRLTACRLPSESESSSTLLSPLPLWLSVRILSAWILEILFQEEKQEYMEKLPREIAMEIFYRLPPESVVQCKLVCKYWRNILPRDDDDGNYFANMNLEKRRHHHHQQRTLGLNFIALHEFSNVKQNGRIRVVGELHITDYDDAEDMKLLIYKLQLKKIKFPQICRNAGWTKVIRTRLAGSCNGLLCLRSKMSNDSKRIGICNPLLNEYVLLPVSDMQRKIEHGEEYNKTTMFIGFGYHPITDEYKIVIINYRSMIGDVEVYTLGKSNGVWRHIGTIKYMLRHGSRPPVLVNGSLHWLSQTQIVSFDLEVEEFHVTPPPLPYSPSGMVTRELKELRGCLSFVCSRSEEMEIWVLKDYMNKESWVKEFSIRWEEITGRYSPCAIMKNKNGDHDQLLLWWNRKKLVSYDPKSRTFEDVEGRRQVDHVIESSTLDQPTTVQGPVIHINSLISLKALGEDPDLYRKSSGNINIGAWKRLKILQRITLKAKAASSWKRKREQRETFCIVRFCTPAFNVDVHHQLL